jgi:transposase InsO family protein
MAMQGRLSIEQMCRSTGVSRAGFYRSLRRHDPAQEEMELRAAIQQVFIEHKRRYGYRRVTRELRGRGMAVNHKRVARLMRLDNLLAVQPRSFVLTTDSEHDYEICLNLARRLTLTGPDQLWVADITYIRLRREFVYLAVVLDAFSRKVVGWNLGRSLQARLPIAALERAIAARRPGPGLVHHSDRGTQYACSDYRQLLDEHHILASMSRPANPYDNAQCESFIRTLKREEIHANSYLDLEDLRARIGEFIDSYYNGQRMHSALGYRSPDEFEQVLEADPATVEPGPRLSFFRHREIYRCDTARERKGRPPSDDSLPEHRIDESPTGYSSAGCSPAEPASASPASTSVNPNNIDDE